MDLAQANGRADHSFQDLKEIMETWRWGGGEEPGLGGAVGRKQLQKNRYLVLVI